MPRQDVDPLADTLPPRYAYESDDEDENHLVDLSSGTDQGTPGIEIIILPPLKEDEKKHEGGGVLIIATGAVGNIWARGAALGEQVGQVNVNKRAIGLVFRPNFSAQGTKGTVIVSEALARLPVWAMNPYAAAVLERWKPSKIIALDAYSTATYISPIPILHHEAPLRYLNTDREPPPSDTRLSLFEPPNLLQSTMAAFLSRIALPQAPSEARKTAKGIAILVPSKRTPLPTPRNLSHDEDDSERNTNSNTGLAALTRLEDAEDWDFGILRATHRVILGAAGYDDSCKEWIDSRKEKAEGVKVAERRRKIAEAEGGMYI